MKTYRKIALGSAFIVALATASYAGSMGGCCVGGEKKDEQMAQSRKFQADTMDLRQEMMNKRFELQRENLKGQPDEAKMTALKADISVIQQKILTIRKQSGLPEKGKRDGECGLMSDCQSQGQWHDHNHDHKMMGNNPPCAGMPCGGK